MLKLTNVHKRYEDFTLDCSMELMPGRITGLIGRNGAGKSTAFKVALGLVRPDGGEVTVFGKPVEMLTTQDRQRIGVAFADAGFSEYLTITDIAPVLAAMYPSVTEKEFLEQCSRMELPLSKKIKEFSTGMRAKLKVLIALDHEAELLILDEPTVGLDVVAREEVLAMIREYMTVHEQAGVLISSHIATDLESLCDDLYLIRDGKIILHEDTDVLLSEYALLKVPAEKYETLDKQYILRSKRESYGYACLTDKKQYYRENEPDLVMENGSIDELILMMNGGRE